MSWVWMSFRVPSLSTEPSFMAMIWTRSQCKYLNNGAVTHFSSEIFAPTQSAWMRYWSLWVTRTTVRLSSCRYFRIPSCIRWSLRWMSRAEKGSSYRDMGSEHYRVFYNCFHYPFINVNYSRNAATLPMRISYLLGELSPEIYSLIVYE